MERAALYPGSFDPVTKGHLDIIKRSSKMFDKLYISVLNNSAKNCSFSIEERMEMLRKCTADIPNVEICTFDGLLVDHAAELGVIAIIRGLRAVTDFDYEFQMALTNKKIDKNIETIFLITNYKYIFLSSSIVKEIARNGGDIVEFVPPAVLGDIEERLKIRKDK